MFGSAFYLTLMWALVADCIDYQERRTGRREESSIYATYSLFRKIAQGVGAAVVSWAIGMTGYDQKLGALEQVCRCTGKDLFRHRVPALYWRTDQPDQYAFPV